MNPKPIPALGLPFEAGPIEAGPIMPVPVMAGGPGMEGHHDPKSSVSLEGGLAMGQNTA